MNLKSLSVAGPFAHENLSIFLLRGQDAFDGSRYLPLDEAMERQCVIVHETGNVGELEVENLSDEFDLYVQAGDVVKGGRQDRTLGVDFVLPAKSGRVPVPSFCVESGRWRRRAAEDVQAFSSSKSILSSKSLRMAAKMSKSQHEVWQQVAAAQEQLSASMGMALHSPASPSSYQLTLEHEDLVKRKTAYRDAFAKILAGVPDAIGYAFVINGAINTADAYGAGGLFRKLWGKLLDAAILEAIGESHRRSETAPPPVTAEAVREWLGETDAGEVSERQEVPPRVAIETRRSKAGVSFSTCDHGLRDAVVHRNVISP